MGMDFYSNLSFKAGSITLMSRFTYTFVNRPVPRAGTGENQVGFQNVPLVRRELS